MPGITETCSVCSAPFDVQFRYQMEERNGGFSFYCSQRCLEKSQLAGGDAEAGIATCDACAKRFKPEFAAQVLYVEGKRNYACSLDCRGQIQREANGARLGDIAAAAAPKPESLAFANAAAVLRDALPKPAPKFTAPVAAVHGPTPPTSAVAVPLVPPARRAAPTKASAPASAPAGEKPQGSPRVIAVFNHKGGTGKTTTAVTVAAGLAQRGKRVLLVDTDAQGNVSVSLGSACERTLYHVLVMGLRVADAARTVRPNLDLLPSNETLAAAELYLAGRQNRDRVLSDRLAAGSAGYDYVVLDCSPSLSLMNQNALVFADSVLVPVACDYLSLVGVRQVIKTVKNVNQLLHHPVQIWGVLPTFYDSRAKICREAVTTLKSHFGERCLAPVRAAMKVKEAPAQGQTLLEYAAGTPAADDYVAVVDQIIAAREGRLVRAPQPEPRQASPLTA